LETRRLAREVADFRQRLPGLPPMKRPPAPTRAAPTECQHLPKAEEIGS
jgi:hypothetical protein